MVVFTCCYCGESVKKNQVEKHYSFTACRRSVPALTCVDCLKDFNGDDHIAHTSCVTEEERYSAKGFVSKPPSNKGAKKQQEWVNFIQRCLERDAGLKGPVRNLLERIANDPGVPQKKAKFMNFCSSKFPYYHSGYVEKTWSFLEKMRNEFQEMCNKGENGEDRKRKRMDSSNECSTEMSENVITDASEHKPEDAGKKKKKRNVQDGSAEPGNDEGIVDANSESKKQKKKRKSSLSNGAQVIDVEDSDDSTECKTVVPEDSKENESDKLLSKKEKKEKRKKEKYEKLLLEIHNEPVVDAAEQDNSVEEATQTRKKKKKKEKRPENGDVKDVEDAAGKTQSKKKHQHQPEQEVEVIQNGEDANHEEVLDAKPSKFNWEETVVKLLESKGEMPLKRVEKKVVNEYINSGVHVESVEKVIAKFNKKIVKMSRVKVKKDIVKLAS